MNTYIFLYLPFHIPLHYGLSQDAEDSALCCMVGLCFWPWHPECNSSHLLTPHSQSFSSRPPSPLDNRRSVLHVCESVSDAHVSSLVSHSRFHFRVISHGVYLSLFDFLRMIVSRSVHVAANGIISFCFMTECYSTVYIYIYACACVYIYHIVSSFHSSLDGRSGCFHVLAGINSAAVNRGACIFLSYNSVWLYAHKWDCWIKGQPYFQFFEESPYCFP